MLLRTRIVVIFGLTTLALLGAVVVPLWVVQDLDRSELAQARQEAQDATWASALSNAATPYEILSARLAADTALQDAIQRDEAAAVSGLLRAALASQPGAAVERLDILTSEGRLFASSAGPAVDTPLIDAYNLRGRLANDIWLLGVEAGADGGFHLVVTSALPGGRVLSVATSLEATLRALAALDERSLFVIDRRGTLLLSSAPAEWPALAAERARSGDQSVMLSSEGHDHSAVSTRLRNTSGLVVGTLVMVQDVTLASQRRTLVLLVTTSGAAVVFAALCLGVYGFARGALDPLTEITRVIRAMAAGDAMVSADLPDRRDEIGAIQAAVEVFRRDIVALARIKIAETLHSAQQQALIRREMGKLAGMLEEPERKEMLTELDEIEAGMTAEPGAGDAALAAGFKQMAARVMAQHRKLSELLASQRRDLEIVRQALTERAQLTRMREELEVARHLQLSSLPSVFPPYPDRHDFEVFASMQPAKEVGGDFYDFVLIDADHLALLIGDASGKGVSGAIFIAMGRSLLRSAMVRGASPAQALALANSTLAVDNPTMMFATVFIAVLNLRTGWLSYASAGHNPPYLVVPDKAPEMLDRSRGIALGIVDEAEYQDEEAQMLPGSLAVLFTDGVTEANALDGSLFGEKRLTDALEALPHAGSEAAVAGVQAAVSSFTAGAEQADDITVLSVRYLGPMADRPGADGTPAQGGAVLAHLPAGGQL